MKHKPHIFTNMQHCSEHYIIHLSCQTVSLVSVFYIFGLPQQAELAQVVPGRLRPRIFLMFDTTRVVGRQPYAPAAFIPGEIPGTHF